MWFKIGVLGMMAVVFGIGIMWRICPTIGIQRWVDLVETEGFLSDEECDAWIQWIQTHPERFVQSAVDRFKGAQVDKAHRNSQQCWVPPTICIDALNILQRVVPILHRYLNGAPYFTEYFQVVRYGRGGVFRPHYDERLSLWRGRYGRDATLLIYLNDSFDGGETVFPRLGRTVVPKKGKAILFRNLHPVFRWILWGAYHEGRPVTKGEKYILNLWIHKK